MSQVLGALLYEVEKSCSGWEAAEPSEQAKCSDEGLHACVRFHPLATTVGESELLGAGAP